MNPTSFFRGRHSELLWFTMAKILLKIPYLVRYSIFCPICPSRAQPGYTTGQALVSFGRAFCNVATAQEALGRSLAGSFIAALQRFVDQIKDYEADRKKLETRRCERTRSPVWALIRISHRLNKDAAMKQVERLENNKKAKEKDRREAEEELEKSESR
jgi:hypothetical protein